MFVTVAAPGREPARDEAHALERGGGFALWRQIAHTLGEEIARGDHPPGSRLATEAELSTRFAVNRHTVRRAVAELGAQGLLRVEQGRGTFVQENVIDYRSEEHTYELQSLMR